MRLTAQQRLRQMHSTLATIPLNGNGPVVAGKALQRDDAASQPGANAGMPTV
jgi:hypothetical protein